MNLHISKSLLIMIDIQYMMDDSYLWEHGNVFDDMPKLDILEVDTIVVHCTDTSCTNVVDVNIIHEWHVARGFDCCGYHFVVKPDGFIQKGRPLAYQGAHCLGHNRRSIGVCYVGGRKSSGAPGDTRTYAQKISLAWLFGLIVTKFPKIYQIVGHNDLANKCCPCFNAKADYANFVQNFRNGKLY